MSDQLNGHQLLRILNSLTAEQLEQPVMLEGCDCTGEAVSVSTSTGEILIERTTGPGSRLVDEDNRVYAQRKDPVPRYIRTYVDDDLTGTNRSDWEDR